MELWIARNKNGCLWLFDGKPEALPEYGCFVEGGYPIKDDSMGLPKEWFPFVTWENSPQKVTLELAEVVHGHLGTELSKCECVQLNAEANPIYSCSIHECGLSVRAMHCLESAGISTIGDLVKWKRSDLLKLRNFGMHTLHEIDDFLTDNKLGYGTNL